MLLLLFGFFFFYPSFVGSVCIPDSVSVLSDPRVDPTYRSGVERNTIVADSGAFYTAGYHKNANNYDGVISKYSLDNNLVWQKEFGALSAWDVPEVLLESGDYLYIAGRTQASSPITQYDLSLTKVAKSDGSEIWSKFIKERLFMRGGVVADNAIFLGAWDDTTTVEQMRILKLDFDGNVLLDIIYDGLDTYARGMSFYDGYLYLGATWYSGISNFNSNQIETFKIDPSNGAVEWYKRTTYSPYRSSGLSVTTNSNGVFVTGIAVNGNNYSYGFLRKYSHDGTIVWTKVFRAESSKHYFFNAITSDDNALYLTGETLTGFGTSGRAMVFAKVDFDGNEVWSSVFDSTSGGDDRGYSIYLSEDKLFVSGITDSFQEAEETGSVIVILNTDGTMTATDTEFTYSMTTMNLDSITPTEEDLSVTTTAKTTEYNTYSWEFWRDSENLEFELLGSSTCATTQSPTTEPAPAEKNIFVLMKDGMKETGWVDGFFVPFWDTDSSNRLYTVTFNDLDSDSQPSTGDTFQFQNPNGDYLKCGVVSCWFGVSGDTFELELISYDDGTDTTIGVLYIGNKYVSYYNSKFSMQSGRKSAAIFKF